MIKLKNKKDNIGKKFKKSLPKNFCRKNIIDNSDIKVVEELLLSKDFINDIDMIKLNLQMNIDITEKFDCNFNLSGQLPILIAILTFSYTNLSNYIQSSLNAILGGASDNLTDELLDSVHNIIKLLSENGYGYIIFIILLSIGFFVFDFLYKSILKKKYIKSRAILKCINIIEKKEDYKNITSKLAI